MAYRQRRTTQLFVLRGRAGLIMATCIKCGESYDDQRSMLGYRVCMECGDADAHKRKHTIAPLNKSNYMLFTDATLLKQLNPKRTT